MNSLNTNNYASLSRRALALILDGIILCIPAALAAGILPIVGGLLAYFLYAPVFESSAIRATPGKYLVGIEVVDLNGERLGFRAALLRNLIKAVSVALLFLGFILALFSDRKQTVHDLVAESLVIYGRTEVPMLQAWVDQVKAIFNSQTLTSTTPQTSPAEPMAPPSNLSALERLQSLRERGALTEEEFQEQKKKLLSL